MRRANRISEERRVDGGVFNCPGCRSDPEVIALEELTETVAVDKVDRWCAVGRCFLLGVGGGRVCGDQQAFVAAAGHRAAEVAYRAGADAAAVSLALEKDREADKPEPVDTESVDTAIAALAGDVDAVEVSQALMEHSVCRARMRWLRLILVGRECGR